MLRPFPADVHHILSLAAAVEITLLLILFILFVFTFTRQPHSRPFLWFCVFFAFSLLITIGYTVNFVGAIVRYRSLAFPFLLIPMICLINWDKIKNKLKLNYSFL